jgi:hypothetical protein
MENKKNANLFNFEDNTHDVADDLFSKMSSEGGNNNLFD